ncbi:MAG: glycoside hydrolase family 2 [Planctomycetes bacterium]|nr:glycoside hydrolase family 2 [Planctomycetota bacterium]
MRPSLLAPALLLTAAALGVAAEPGALPAAPAPLPAWLPAPVALHTLPPAIAAGDWRLDLGGGSVLTAADLGQTIDLDGAWRCSGLTSAAARFADDAQLDQGYERAEFDDAKWDEIAVPLDWYRRYPKARTKATPFSLGWYRRAIEVPELAGRRAVLTFDVAGYEAELWVNGVRAGEHHGDFTPFIADIAPHLRPGRNVLALRVRSDLGPNFGAGQARHAYGSQWGIDNIKGGLWQSCRLRLEPALRVASLEVSPLFEQGRVRLDWKLENHRGAALPARLRAVIHGARQGGEGVRPADAVVAELEIPAGASEGRAELAVPGIATWSPQQPNLHFATLVALDPAGKVLGARSERFGFRGIKADGGRFLLNGKPAYLFGENFPATRFGGHGETAAKLAATLAAEVADMRANGYTMVRNAHMPMPTALLDAADEQGLMIFDEWAWSFTKDLDAQEFPRRNLRELAEWVRRDYNHPSVAMWSCGNEVSYDAPLVHAQLDAQVAAVRALDRSGRPVSTFSGAAFGYGAKALETDVLDLHDYLGLSEAPWTTWRRNAARCYSFLDKAYGAGVCERKPFIVWECVGFSWGQKSDASYKPGDAEAYVRWAGKTTSWGQPEGVGFTGTIGLAAALDPKRGLAEGRSTYGRRIGEAIRRDPVCDGFAPWFHGRLEAARQWTQPVLASMAGANGLPLRHPLGGSRIEQTVTVINSGSEVLDGAQLRVLLAGADGAERELARLPVPTIAAMGRAELPLAATLPAVAAAGWWQLRLAVEAGGAERSRLGYDLYVAPPAAAPLPAARPVALLPGDGAPAVRAWLEALGVRAQDATPAALGEAELAIVPPGCVLTAEQGFALRAWVREGHDLLVLEQGAGEVAALRLGATGASQTFVDLVSPQHPLFAGLDQAALDTSDLADRGLWVRVGLTPVTSTVLAARGPFLGQSGVSAVVAEGALGKGRILASQLVALEQYGRDSVATTYLRNLAAYILAPGAKPVATVRPWQEAGGGLSVERDRCVPLDLAKASNRGFRDDLAEDGAGGWTDQGSNDFRLMPLGAQLLHGVPMTIIDPEANGGRSCIVLGGAGRPAFPRAAEGIPVGFAAARLFFLHTAAWVGGHGSVLMSYRVRYADGQQLDIPVRAGIEIADWWNPAELAGARLGLSRTNDQLRDVGVFLMAWENPRPEAVISAVDVLSPGVAVPITVAITAERAHPAPLAFAPRWSGLADRPRKGGVREGPGIPPVTAAGERGPAGGEAQRIAFPSPVPLDPADQVAWASMVVPAAMTAMDEAGRKRLGEGSWRYLTLWIKAEQPGTLDLVLPRADWKDSGDRVLVLDPTQGWRKVRLSLAADLQIGTSKTWEAKDLRGELFLFHGRRQQQGAPLPKPLTVLVADARLE